MGCRDWVPARGECVQHNTRLSSSLGQTQRQLESMYTVGRRRLHFVATPDRQAALLQRTRPPPQPHDLILSHLVLHHTPHLRCFANTPNPHHTNQSHLAPPPPLLATTPRRRQPPRRRHPRDAAEHRVNAPTTFRTITSAPQHDHQPPSRRPRRATSNNDGDTLGPFPTTNASAPPHRRQPPHCRHPRTAANHHVYTPAPPPSTTLAPARHRQYRVRHPPSHHYQLLGTRIRYHVCTSCWDSEFGT